MRVYRSWWLIAGLAAVLGCSRQPTVPCQPDARYATARSAPPVQIPDDLSPPDESDAIRLPPGAAGAPTTAGECLEAPPSFFGDSRPFSASEPEESRAERRRERREERRRERDESPPEQPAPAPADEDRVITD